MDEDLPTFHLERFNPRRAERGARAAEVAVTDSTGTQFLWMSLSDVLQNISEWGPQPGLVEAREAYRNWRPNVR